MSNLLKSNKPFKIIKIDGENIKVEIVEQVPSNYTYVKNIGDLSLFMEKTLFGDKNNYLLCKKKFAKKERNND